MAGALNLTASQEDIKQLLLEYTLQEETIDTRTAQLCIKPSLFLWIRAITAQEEGKGASLSRRISNDSFRRH